MKPFLAVIGIALLVVPVLRFLAFHERAAEVESKEHAVGLLVSIPGGLMQGFAGLMLLGFLCDGGSGYKPIWLLAAMALVGITWSLVYPSGWMLGIPLIIYSGEKLLRAKCPKRSGANTTLDTNA